MLNHLAFYPSVCPCARIVSRIFALAHVLSFRSPDKKSVKRTPIQDRVNEIEKKKAAKRLQTQMEVEEAEDCSFRPKVSAVSERMVLWNYSL